MAAKTSVAAGATVLAREYHNDDNAQRVSIFDLSKIYMNNGTGQPIWCLAINAADQVLEMEYIDLHSYKTKKILLNYPFVLFVAMPRHAVKHQIFDLLLNEFTNEITSIYDSDFSFLLAPNNFLRCLLQENFTERAVKYDLVAIQCANIKSYWQIHKFLLNNNAGKDLYYLLNVPEWSMMLALYIMFRQLTIPRTFIPSPTGNQIGKLHFCKMNLVDRNIGPDFYELNNYFVNNGVYLLTNARELELVSSDTAKLFGLLPIISFDIETVANDMTAIPFGNTMPEQLVSYVLFGRYLNQTIIIVSYLRFFQLPNISLQWDDIDSQMAKKLQILYSAKYDGNVHVFVRSCISEQNLLENFIFWYARGTLLKLLTGNINQTHFFVGHNIINYDNRFILTRLKCHQMHDIVANCIFVDENSGCDEIVIRFHSKAIVVDTLLLFKKHQLAFVGALKLKQLSTKYVSDIATKLDVDAVLIRIIYIIDRYLKTNVLSPEALGELYPFIQNLLEIRMPDSNLMAKTTDLDYHMIELNVKNFPSVLKAALTHGHQDIDRVVTHTIDQILHYNVVDCECVIALLDKFDYKNLFMELIKLYPGNFSSIVHSNTSRRSIALLSAVAIQYNQMIPVVMVTQQYPQKRFLMPNTTSLMNLLCSATAVVTAPPSIALASSTPRVKFDVTTVKAKIRTKTATVATIPASPKATNGNITSSENEESYVNARRAFRDAFIVPPVYSDIQLKATKKHYIGAIVFSKTGIYQKTIQFDVTSMYPSIIAGKQFNVDSVDMLSVQALLDILTYDRSLQQHFDSLLATGQVKLFSAEDSLRNYFSYLSNFNYSPGNGYTKISVVGQLILTYDQLRKITNPHQPLIMCTGESCNFLPNFIAKILKSRKALQTAKKATTDVSQRAVYECRQLALKVLINSVYGVFGNVYAPVAAATTLYGRKILMLAAKISIIITVDVAEKIFQFIQYFCKITNQNSAQLLQWYSGHITKERSFVENLVTCDKDDIMLLPTSEHFSRLLEMFNLTKCQMTFRMLVKSFSIIKCIFFPKETTIATTAKFPISRDDITLLFHRVALDGSENFNDIQHHERRLNRLILMATATETKTINNPDICDLRNSDTWCQETFERIPSSLREMIYDGDTDGFQYKNILYIDGNFLKTELNILVQQILCIPTIVFEPKFIDATFCLTKKKYTVFSRMPSLVEAFPLGLPPQSMSILLSKTNIYHSGYEKNALPGFKFLCSYMAALCYYYRDMPKETSLSYKDIIFSFFAYLDNLDSGEIYVSIALNRQKNDSPRKKFIDKYTTMYVGTLKAVYIYNRINNLEQLMLINEYQNNKKKLQLQYAYFFRTFGKIWYDQFCLAYQTKYGVPAVLLSTPKEKIIDLYHRYFIEWIELHKPNPFGDSLLQSYVGLRG